MSQLAALKAATSLRDVAVLLGYRPGGLAYILYKKPPAAKYRSFTIPKRGGGDRPIDAPDDDLKLLQKKVSHLLQNCLEEINTQKNHKDQMSHGFKRSRSIVTNAVKHRGREFVFNIDLENFFPAINFGRVRGFFIKDANFLLNPHVATVLAQIACHPQTGSLPQGGPCSPVISNLIGHILDIRLARLAFKNGCTYSRYADDITFSTSKRPFPEAVAGQSPPSPHKWEPSEELTRAIVGAGFAINAAKTRMQYRTSRQVVTGLVVNRKVNVSADYRRLVRAMAHRVFMTGKFQHGKAVTDAAAPSSAGTADGTLAQLQGKFGHIDKVDRYKLEEAKKKEAQAKGAYKDRKQTKKLEEDLAAKELIYRRFLIFKEFYQAPRPVVICEGKTDAVYLRCAVKSLAARYPRLATVASKGQVALLIRIFRRSDSGMGRVLRLRGGAGELKRFVGEYPSELVRFRVPGEGHAVILVSDNDAAGRSVLAHAEGKRQKASTDHHVHVARNLYVVSLPPAPDGGDSTIEDLLPDDVKRVQLGGKTFRSDGRNSGFDSTKHFGKTKLADYVREKASRIDFSGFAELLDRIAEAIEVHERTRPTATKGAGGVSTSA